VKIEVIDKQNIKISMGEFTTTNNTLEDAVLELLKFFSTETCYIREAYNLPIEDSIKLALDLCSQK
jgi:hypothetical protein